MKIVALNWKMNPPTFAEAKRLFDATKKAATGLTKTRTIVAPPATFLRDLAKGYKGKAVAFGSQNIHFEEKGSYTGEIAASHVADSGASYAIIGHAERRKVGETDDDVRKKVFAALQHKLKPIICIGESVRDAKGEYVQVVREQITTAMKDVPQSRYGDITIAYEPVWAIGAPEAPDAHEVHQMMILVRKTLMDTLGSRAMSGADVLYGGAVNDENADAIFSVPDLDGVLVGRASLSAERVRELLKAANRN